MVDRRLCVVRSEQMPHVIILRRAEIETRQRRQIGRYPRCTDPFEQRGTRDEALATVTERAHHEITVLQRRRTHSNRDVDRFADDVDAPVRRFEVQLHARILREERRKHRGDARIQQRDRARDADDAARFGAREFDRFLCRLRLDEHRLAMGVVVLTDLRDREAARRTLNQPNAEPLFEQRDAPAEFRFRDAERATGRRKTAVVDHFGEVIEVVEILHRVGLQRSRFGTLRINFADYRCHRCGIIVLSNVSARRPIQQENDT